MKLKTLLVAGGVGVLLLAATAIPVLRAQQQHAADDLISGNADSTWMQRPMAGVMLRRVAERLHLTADQKTAGLAVLRNHQPALTPLVNRVIAERFALRKLLQAPTVDETAVRAQSAQVAGVEADLAVQKAYLFHDLRAVATPAQLATISEMQANSEARVLKVVDLVSDWIAHS